MATRRRRARRHHGVLGFLKRHWLALLILVVAIVLIIVLANSNLSGELSKAIFGTENSAESQNQSNPEVTPVAQSNQVIPGNQATQAPAQLTATFDGSRLSLFGDQESAEANKSTVEAGVKTITVSGSNNISVSASIGGRSANILSNNGNDSYTLDLSNVADNSTVIIRVETNEDSSVIGKRLGMSGTSEAYFALSVSNPVVVTEEEATAALGIPNGRIYFGEDVYPTYASEGEAYQAVKSQRSEFTIPYFMVENGLQLRAEPNENTARIRIQLCMVDGKPVSITGVLLSNNSNWTGTLRVGNYLGKQVTLMIHAENAMGLSNGYSYVSFFVPEPIQEDSEPVG